MSFAVRSQQNRNVRTSLLQRNPVYTFTSRVSSRKLYPLHKLQFSFNFNDPSYFNTSLFLAAGLLTGSKIASSETSCKLEPEHPVRLEF